MSGVAGNILGLTAGGYIAQYYGWRATFYCAGLPGILLAIIAWAALRDPRAAPTSRLPLRAAKA